MRPTTLRTRFLVVILLCVLLPVGVTGAWIGRSARRSGEAAVRLRLESSLSGAEQAIAYRWIEQRSALYALAGDSVVRWAIREGAALPEPTSELWGRVSSFVAEVKVVSLEGVPLGHWASAGPAREAIPTTLTVRVPIHEAPLGPLSGHLVAEVLLVHLLPPGFGSVGIGGGVVSLFGEHDEPLLASPLGADLLSTPRFSWNGDDWTAAQRRLHDPPLRIVLAAPLGPVAEPFGRAARQGLMALFAVSGLALLAGALLSARLTRALERLSLASAEVAGGRLDGQVPEVGSEEVRRLSRSFNEMTTSLRSLLRTVARQKAAAAVGEFAASLAHEVRNPLTAIRLDLEHLRGRLQGHREALILDETLAQIDRLDATVSGALRIAASGAIEMAPLDLRAPLAAAARSAGPRVDASGASLEVALPDVSLEMKGNGPALEQLFLNLILNGGEAAGPGGHVRVGARRADGILRVEVADDGPGIPAEGRERVFEPFFTTRAGGTGLGLAVSRRIALAHGADLSLQEGPAGGAVAVFEVPVAGLQS